MAVGTANRILEGLQNLFKKINDKYPVCLLNINVLVEDDTSLHTFMIQ